MSDLNKLEAMYEKEIQLYQLHKAKSEDLKKRIDEEKGISILKGLKQLKLSTAEFNQFQKAIKSEKNVKKLIEEMNTHETETATTRER